MRLRSVLGAGMLVGLVGLAAPHGHAADFTFDGNVTVSTNFSVGSVSNVVGPYAVAQGVGVTASGVASHAEGVETAATAAGTHAEGQETQAGNDAGDGGWFAHAEGRRTRAIGDYSHAEGDRNIATGEASHAEGNDTEAHGITAHAEGYYTVASGFGSHAEGGTNWASGDFSHAEGVFTRATGHYSHAEGAGHSEEGVWIYYSEAAGESSHVEGHGTYAEGFSAHAEGDSSSAYGDAAHAEGRMTLALGYSSHSEGAFTDAIGDFSHSEGQNTEASGTSAHAEGGSTLASGHTAHAEGYNTEATANYSHAEGVSTIASGIAAHAEGHETLASGDYSHAAGSGARATNRNTFVWSDGAVVGSTTTNQFTVYASAGIRLLGGPISGKASGLTDFPASVSTTNHTHDASAIVSGTLNDSRLSSAVSLLGQSIGTAELESGSVTTGKLDLAALDARYVMEEEDPDFQSWLSTNANVDLDGTDDLKKDGSVPMTGNLRLNGRYISGDGGDEGVYVAGSGNVGIGTNSPAVALDVAGAGRFLDGIVYVPARGNLSMGVYTNMPSL